VSAPVTTGYVSAQVRPSIATQARRSPLLFVGVALFIIILTVLITQSRPSDFRPYSIDNSAPEGTRAVAQILRKQGISVSQIGLLSSAHIADPANTTLVIADPHYLLESQVASIAAYPGDIVYLGISQEALTSADAALWQANTPSGPTLSARCDDADALAAQQITGGGDGIGSGPDADAELCFADTQGNASFARVETDLGTRTFIAQPAIATNGELDELGNAALTLRSMGQRSTLTWYLGDFTDSSVLTWGTGGDGAPKVDANPDFLPPGTTDALFALALAALVAALWRARRFGPLVTEPLPVVVRSSEATRGRARLYRRARATGRSSAALRALAAVRMGRRLGVPRAAHRAALVTAIERATGRPGADVDALVYGPPPANEAEMMHLVHQLDQLESEVHRP